MFVLKVAQWILGLFLIFYFYKALLGKLQEGEGKKAALMGVTWLAIAVLASGIVQIK